MRSLALTLALAATSAAAEVPQVVTDTPVVHSLVASVMGDLGAPGVLLTGGADAHDFQLRPSQRGELGAADVVFWIGPEMTPWLGRALEATAPGRSVALLQVDDTRLRPFDEAEALHEDHDDGHDHAGIDPHAWLDPANGALWLDTIAGTLAEMDGAHADTYRANADTAKAAIAAVVATIEADLAATPRAPVVVSHDALGYFADRFGLTIAERIAEGDAATPGAAHLSEIRALLEQGGAVCVFPEAGSDPKIIEALAEGTTARIGRPLDPEGRVQNPGPGLYRAVLEGTAAAFRDCLAGGN
jgi:zinc transport system substrate-binding protein